MTGGGAAAGRYAPVMIGPAGAAPEDLREFVGFLDLDSVEFDGDRGEEWSGNMLQHLDTSAQVTIDLDLAPADPAMLALLFGLPIDPPRTRWGRARARMIRALIPLGARVTRAVLRARRARTWRKVARILARTRR